MVIYYADHPARPPEEREFEDLRLVTRTLIGTTRVPTG
jgi:hypothetical protein